MLTLEIFEKDFKPTELQGYYQEEIAECFKDSDGLNVADTFATYRCLYFNAKRENVPAEYKQHLLSAMIVLDVLSNTPGEELKNLVERIK